MLDLGSSLEVSDYAGGSVSFAPAVGGPVTLTTGTLSIDPNASLTGTDSFVVDGPLTLGASSQLSVSGTVDAYGGTGSAFLRHHPGTTLNNHGAATWDLDGGAAFYADGTVALLAERCSTTWPVRPSRPRHLRRGHRGDGFNNAGTFISSTAVGGDVSFNLFYNTGTVVVQGGELELTSDGVTPNTGTITAAAGTSLVLFDEVLAPTSVISSDGNVGLYGCTEAGSFGAAGGTFATDSTFTGPVLDLGGSLGLELLRWFSQLRPAAGGPVTLTTGALTIDPNAILTGTDSFAADGLLTLSTDRSSASRAAWTPTAGWL